MPTVARRPRRGRGARSWPVLGLLSIVLLLFTGADPTARTQRQPPASVVADQTGGTTTIEEIGPATKQESPVFVGPPVPPGLAKNLPPARPAMEEIGEGVFTVSDIDDLFIVKDADRNAVARVTPVGLVLILDPSPADSNALEDEAVARIAGRLRQVGDQPTAYVVGSHTHGNTRSFPDGTAILHRNAWARMEKTGTDTLSPGGSTPFLVFKTRSTLFAGNVEIRLHHLGPGHTDGDVVAEFPDLGVVYTGDLVVDETPFVDYTRGGTSTGWVTALGQLLALDFTTAIPGRGPAMSRHDVQVFRDKLVTLRARMVQLIREGATVEDVTSGRALLSTADLDWPLDADGPFMRSHSLGALYDEVSVLPEAPPLSLQEQPSVPR